MRLQCLELDLEDSTDVEHVCDWHCTPRFILAQAVKACLHSGRIAHGQGHRTVIRMKILRRRTQHPVGTKFLHLTLHRIVQGGVGGELTIGESQDHAVADPQDFKRPPKLLLTYRCGTHGQLTGARTI